MHQTHETRPVFCLPATGVSGSTNIALDSRRPMTDHFRWPCLSITPASTSIRHEPPAKSRISTSGQCNLATSQRKRCSRHRKEKGSSKCSSTTDQGNHNNTMGRVPAPVKNLAEALCVVVISTVDAATSG